MVQVGCGWKPASLCPSPAHTQHRLPREMYDRLLGHESRLSGGVPTWALTGLPGGLDRVCAGQEERPTLCLKPRWIPTWFPGGSRSEDFKE